MNKKRTEKDFLTFKDLNYLSDVFQKSYDAYKFAYFSMSYIKNPHVLETYQDALDLFDKELRLSIHVLKNPGGDFDE